MVAFWTGELEVPIVRSVELLDDVALGSKADITNRFSNVRFTPESGHSGRDDCRVHGAPMLLCAFRPRP